MVDTNWQATHKECLSKTFNEEIPLCQTATKKMAEIDTIDLIEALRYSLFLHLQQVWFSNRRARLRKEEYYTETRTQARPVEVSKSVTTSYGALTSPSASFTRIFFPNGASCLVPHY